MRYQRLKSLAPFVIFTLIAALSVLFRTYKIDSPVADWHSWRQSDTAAVAQLYMQNGIDLLHPRYYDISNIQSGKDNPEGWRMVEFPLYQGVGALLTQTVGMASVEVWLRIISIFWSTVAAIGIGVLIRRRGNALAGYLASLVYAGLPYSVFYGRTILPDVSAVGMVVLALVLLDFAFGQKSIRQGILIIASAVFSSLALLTKPVAGFLLIPAASAFLIMAWKHKNLFFWAIVYGIISFVPFFLWREWITRFPEGIASFSWLFNKDNIRFKGAWFRWIFQERIGVLIMGTWGLIPLGVGMFAAKMKDKLLVFPMLILGSLLYIGIIAGGNVQHDYYQIFLLPVLCGYTGLGLAYLVRGAGNTGVQRAAGLVGAGLSFVFMCMFSWYTIRTYYWINHPEIVEAGKEVDRLFPKDAKVIATYGGDTTFLYQTKRMGWPIGFLIPEKIKQGARVYVSVADQKTDGEILDLASKYRVVSRTPTFIIIDLGKPAGELPVGQL